MKYLILTEGSIGPRKDKNCSKHSPRTESKNNCHTNKTYPRVHYSSVRFSLRFACGGKCVCSLALFSFLLFEVRKSGTRSAIAPSLGYPATLVVEGLVEERKFCEVRNSQRSRRSWEGWDGREWEKPWRGWGER